MLLAGVYAATLNFWLLQEQEDRAALEFFLRARIEDVLKLGRKINEAKDFVMRKSA